MKIAFRSPKAVHTSFLASLVIASGLNAQRCADPPKLTSLDEQAIDLVGKRFANLILKCGESYFIWVMTMPAIDKNAIRIYELRQPCYYIQKLHQISRADKLNGYEWSGLISLFAPAFRYRNISPRASTWTQFADGEEVPDSILDFDPDFGRFLTVRVQKVNGRWAVEDPLFELLPKLSCSDLAKLR